jgi:hypothetical protein
MSKAETQPQENTPEKPEGVDAGQAADGQEQKKKPVEIGGPPGPEPTRFGDWENKGRCTDF